MNAVFSIGLIFLAFFACNLGDRIRVEKTVQNTEDIRAAQIRFRDRHRRYADLQEIVDFAGLDTGLRDGKDSGYVFNLEVTEARYQLTVVPDLDAGYVKGDESEQLSLYVDQTGILRASVNPRVRADSNSSEIKPKH